MIEEHAAEDRICEQYRDIKRSLRVPLVNSFFKAIGSFPDFLDTFWTAAKLNLSTAFFISAARRARVRSDSIVGALFEFVDDYAWLKERKFSREDMREIRYAVEMFHYVLPKVGLLASHLKLSLDGEEFSPKEKREADTQEPDFSVKVHIVRPDSAPREVRYLYDDIIETTNLPIINNVYQVLARWPDYLKHVWHDEVKPVVVTQDYERESERLREFLDETARQLPYPFQPPSDILEGETGKQIRKVASFFHKILPGELIVVSGIRRMLVEGERIARAADERLERAV